MYAANVWSCGGKIYAINIGQSLSKQHRRCIEMQFPEKKIQGKKDRDINEWMLLWMYNAKKRETHQTHSGSIIPIRLARCKEYWSDKFSILFRKLDSIGTKNRLFDLVCIACLSIDKRESEWESEPERGESERERAREFRGAVILCSHCQEYVLVNLFAKCFSLSFSLSPSSSLFLTILLIACDFARHLHHRLNGIML